MSASGGVYGHGQYPKPTGVAGESITTEVWPEQADETIKDMAANGWGLLKRSSNAHKPGHIRLDFLTKKAVASMKARGMRVPIIKPNPPRSADPAAFDARLADWLGAMQEKIDAEYAAQYKNVKPPILEIEQGARYIRVVNTDAYGTSRSAFVFIDKNTGDVLKPAGWKGPAKHARGNIFDAKGGLGWMGVYGAAHVRNNPGDDSKSWVVTRRSTGEVIGEFFDYQNVRKFDPKKVIIETARQYLYRINDKIKKSAHNPGRKAMKTVRCKSGIRGTQEKLRSMYDNFAEFKYYSGMYGLHRRLGFRSAKAAWDANPTVQHSVVPGDFRVVKSGSRKRRLNPRRRGKYARRRGRNAAD